MKIAVVHSFYRSGPSGENLAVQLQAEALKWAGHQVQLIATHSEQLSRKRSFGWEASFTVATGYGRDPLADLSKFDPDLVHVHNLFPNWGSRWLSHVEVPTVATLHNFRPVCAAATLSLEGQPCELCPTGSSFNAVVNKCYKGSRLKTIPLAIATHRPESNRLLRDSTGLIYLSDEAEQKFQTLLPNLSVKPSIVLPNFADEQTYKVGNPDRAGKPWLFVGRLSEEKGIIPLLRNWPGTETLIVAGSGPLETVARQTAEGKNISFLGSIGPESIRKLMSSSRALLLPSMWLEGFPLVFAEALSSGLPVLAKSGSGPARIVQEEGGGVVFNSFENLSEAMRAMNHRLGAVTAEATEIYERLFSKKTWTKSITEFYQSFLRHV